MKLILHIAAALMVFATLQSQDNTLLKVKITSQLEQHQVLYRHFHKNPELSFREFNTSVRLAGELEKLGYELTRNIGGNGFVGVLRNGEGPVIMVRTDMDALPLEEKTGLSFASKVMAKDDNGKEVHVMHACGHDMHMTVWLGTASAMAALKDHWKGTLIMVSQQAEEKSGGADAMIEEGLFKRFPLPDYALAYHVSAELPAGTIGYRQGPFMAGVNSVDITVHGIGGHGAMPHTTVDPIVLASRMVLAFQTITSREISPLEPAVVTVGSFHGGTVYNIIPDRVDLQLTVRYYSDEVHAHILKSLERISVGIAQSAGLPESKYPEIHSSENPTPPVINDDALTLQAVSSFRKILGHENVVEVLPVTAGEDFAYYGRTPEKVPIAMFWLGSVEPDRYREHKESGLPLPGLHNPEFYPDFERSYTTGVGAMSQALLDLFNR